MWVKGVGQKGHNNMHGNGIVFATTFFALLTIKRQKLKTKNKFVTKKTLVFGCGGGWWVVNGYSIKCVACGLCETPTSYNFLQFWHFEFGTWT